MKDRRVLHLDLDCFYAAVEQRDNPALRGKPVVVGGDPYGRGVVATASYEARAFGVHSAQSCKVALQLCPEAIFIRPRFDAYKALSQQILSIYTQITPLVEPVALDEAYLDVSALVNAEVSATQIAHDIKQTIVEQTELTASAGVSYCKFVSKLASAFRKPDGLTVVTPQQAPRFLEALPVGKFFGVGDVTEARLKVLGIVSGDDLKHVSLERLQELFGKRGILLYQFVRGEDDRAVQPERERKSVGKETTFADDTTNREDMLHVLEHLSEQVAQRLDELDLTGKTVTLKLRWYDFESVTRSISMSPPIHDAPAMMQSLRPLLDHVLVAGKPVRLLGVTLSGLLPRCVVEYPPLVHTPSLWEMGKGEKMSEEECLKSSNK